MGRKRTFIFCTITLVTYPSDVLMPSHFRNWLPVTAHYVSDLWSGNSSISPKFGAKSTLASSSVIVTRKSSSLDGLAERWTQEFGQGVNLSK